MNLAIVAAAGAALPAEPPPPPPPESRAFEFSGSVKNRFSGGAATATPAAWTLAAWVKIANTDAARSIFVRSAGSPASAWAHGMIHQTVFTAYVYTNLGGRSVTGATTITPGSWYHVVVCATNAGTLKLYVNGTAEGTPAAIATAWTSGNDWWIAAATGAQAAFIGSLADAAIWARELTAGEIAALAAAALGAPASLHAADLILYCPMNDDAIGQPIAVDWIEDGPSSLTQTRTGNPVVGAGP